jgi:hypothetical protein
VSLTFVICPHDPAIRPSEQGPEWYCRECAWVLPLARRDNGGLESVNAALRGLGAAAPGTKSNVAARSPRSRQSVRDGAS